MNGPVPKRPPGHYQTFVPLTIEITVPVWGEWFAPDNPVTGEGGWWRNIQWNNGYHGTIEPEEIAEKAIEALSDSHYDNGGRDA